MHPRRLSIFFFFFFNDTATTEIYTLSLHDALPICRRPGGHGHVRRHGGTGARRDRSAARRRHRSEEHTSELQSRRDLVCRLLLEKKKKKNKGSMHKWKYSNDVRSVNNKTLDMGNTQ